MKMLRSNITKIGIIALLYCGLMIAIVKPVQAAQSNKDFANWLQSLAKKTDTVQVKKELSSLRNSTASLNRLIEQASKIVSENNDDFNLPSSAASDDIQQILLMEWNQFQSGSAMAAVPLVENGKSFLTVHQQKSMTPDLKSEPPTKAKITPYFISRSVARSIAGDVYFTVPMVSGIAIGAP